MSNDTNTARAAMRHLGAWLATGLVLLLLNACGGGSDSIENQIVVRKTMVVGSAEEIAQKRNATKSVKKNKLNASVLHTKHVKGVPVSDDAPHPYILSSGHISCMNTSSATPMGLTS